MVSMLLFTFCTTIVKHCCYIVVYSNIVKNLSLVSVKLLKTTDKYRALPMFFNIAHEKHGRAGYKAMIRFALGLIVCC